MKHGIEIFTSKQLQNKYGCRIIFKIYFRSRYKKVMHIKLKFKSSFSFNKYLIVIFINY